MEIGGSSNSAEGIGGGGGGSPLLKAMLDNFRDPCLERILERLDAILTESTSYTKNPAAMRHEVCFQRERSRGRGSGRGRACACAAYRTGTAARLGSITRLPNGRAVGC